MWRWVLEQSLWSAREICDEAYKATMSNPKWPVQCDVNKSKVQTESKVQDNMSRWEQRNRQISGHFNLDNKVNLNSPSPFFLLSWTSCILTSTFIDISITPLGVLCITNCHIQSRGQVPPTHAHPSWFWQLASLLLLSLWHVSIINIILSGFILFMRPGRTSPDCKKEWPYGAWNGDWNLELGGVFHGLFFVL